LTAEPSLEIVNAGFTERTRGREPAAPGLVNAGCAGEIVKGEPAFDREIVSRLRRRP